MDFMKRNVVLVKLDKINNILRNLQVNGKEMKVNGLIAELCPSMFIFSLLPFSINWQAVSLSRLLNFVSEK